MDAGGNTEPSTSQILQDGVTRKSNNLAITREDSVETHLINTPDDGIVYIETGGSVLSPGANPLDPSSKSVPLVLDPSSINQNYLFVVESDNNSHVIPSNVAGSILINTESGESSALLETNRKQNNKGSQQHGQEHVVLIDGSQYNSGAVLVDPSVFVASYSSIPSNDGELSPASLVSDGGVCTFQQPYIQLDDCETTASGIGSSQALKNIRKSQTIKKLSMLASPSKLTVSAEQDTKQLFSSGSFSGGLGVQKHKQESQYLKESLMQLYGKEIEKEFGDGKKREKEEVENVQEKEVFISQCIGTGEEFEVFTSISAQINAELLTRIPGCQRFLLDKMKQQPQSSQHLNITFKSEVDCIFTGSLKSLIQVHNELKDLTHNKQPHTRLALSQDVTKCVRDEAVMCTLLQPFISLRGRQPKYSVKAKALQNTVDFESLLNIDNTMDDMDQLFDPPSKQRRKQVLHKRLHDSGKMLIKEKVVDIIMGKGESGLGWNDTLQQRLEEEEQCVDQEPSPGKIARPTASETDAPVSKRKTAQMFGIESVGVVTRRRGRPPKSSKVFEKVKPRNPVTESETTKQFRVYEEKLPFKFFCKKCSFKTRRHSHFLIHMAHHNKYGSEKTFTCTVCDFVTLSKSNLKQHEMKHKKNLYSCEECGVYQTDKIGLLHKHIKLKHRQKSDDFKCDLCDFKSTREKDLEKHKLCHKSKEKVDNEDRFKCPVCSRVLRSKMHLRRHIRDVHGPDVRPHLCDVCGKAFKRTDALKQHRMVHLEVEERERNLKFSCATCGKAMRSQAHLQEHMAIHTKERPFLCHYCGAAFKTQAVQKKHVLTVHIRPKSHVCSLCSRQFNTKYALKRHEESHAEICDPQAPAKTEGESTSSEEREKLRAVASIEVQPNAVSDTSQETPNCLVENIMQPSADAPTGIDDQTYIQEGTDGTTLYYFTGELNSL